MRVYISICLSLFGICLIFPFSVKAESQKKAELVLFTGEVTMIGYQSQEKSAKTGDQFDLAEWKEIRLRGTHLFIYYRGSLIEVKGAGQFKIASLLEKRPSPLNNLLSFLQDLSSPRNYIKGIRTRGKAEDEQIFDEIWRKSVLESPKIVTKLEAADLLAAAAWFEKRGESAKVAFLLERLAGSKSIPFFKNLQSSAIQRVSFADINNVLEKTRIEFANKVRPLKYMALLIGVEEYDNPDWQSLKTPAADIDALEETLIKKFGTDPKQITKLLNPGYDEIIATFQNLKSQVSDNTTLLVYYAGHGFYPLDEEEGYWIPKDGGSRESQRFFIPTSMILGKIKALKTKHTLLIADSCFSGSLIQRSRGIENAGLFFQELSNKKSRQIITSGGLEPVSDKGFGENSIFTETLLELLNKVGTEPLSASELAIRLRKGVKNAGYVQTPEYGRLQIKDDEKGEFFFVAQTQTPTLITSELQSHIEDGNIIEDETKKEEEFQLTEKSNGLELGIESNNKYFTYRQKGSSNNGQEEVTAFMNGGGIRLGHHWRNQRWTAGINLHMGSYKEIRTCLPAEDNGCDDHESAEESGEPFKGEYFIPGMFANYTFVVAKYFRLMGGGEIRYQYTELESFYGIETLRSASLDYCLEGAYAFVVNRWSFRNALGFCFPALKIEKMKGLIASGEEREFSSIRTNNFSFSIDYSY